MTFPVSDRQPLPGKDMQQKIELTTPGRQERIAHTKWQHQWCSLTRVHPLSPHFMTHNSTKNQAKKQAQDWTKKQTKNQHRDPIISTPTHFFVQEQPTVPDEEWDSRIAIHLLSLSRLTVSYPMIRHRKRGSSCGRDIRPSSRSGIAQVLIPGSSFGWSY